MYEIVDRDSYIREREDLIVDAETGQAELKEEWDYEPEPEESFDLDYLLVKQSDLISVSPSQFTEFAIRMPDKEKQIFVPFSFDNRRYLQQIYNTQSKRTLLKCGRQVEKSQVISSTCRHYDGMPILAGNVQVGHWLATMANDGSQMTSGQVVWVSRRYVKPCVRIKTRQGHTTEVALTHPMRTWDSWTEAGQLTVGMKIAAVRQCGVFHQRWAPEQHRIRLTAYLIGDGCIGGNHGGNISFVQMPGVVLDEFCNDVTLAGSTYRLNEKKGTKAQQVNIHENGNIRGWMNHDGLENTVSRTKFVPYWVWGLSKEDTALFLNRLWATDGHVKQNTRSKYSLEYCSVSKRLVQDVQALLWKFGIPSSTRQFWPNYWKDQGIEEYAHILRIETKDGIHRFLSEIAFLGKSERCPVPEEIENNNRDTYPIEINRLIKRIIDSRGNKGRMGRSAEKSKSLRTAGLRETLKYPPTWQKLQQYVDFFKSDQRYDQYLVADLEKHIRTDLYWDEIEEIIPIGEQECVDFEVEGTHNFVADGLITHNSTLLGNKLLSYSCINTSLNSLYVSPTNQQTKAFSQDRLKEPIETSEWLKAWTTTKLSDNIFLKKFINRSQITLRYAYLNADRCLAGNTRIQLANGTWITLDQMCRQGGVYQVIASDRSGQPCVATATYPRSMGIREVVDVHTDYPTPLRCTPDHEILTHRGWVQAQNLEETDFIAAPHAGGLFTTTSIGEDLAWVIGAMIAEGECSDPKSVRFCNTDEEYFLTFREKAERIGIKLGKTIVDTRYPRPCYVIGLYSDQQLPWLNGAKKDLWNIGEFGEKSWDKHIPSAIFQATNSEKAAFLHALFGGDGWCTEYKGTVEAGYCTSSKKLGEDLCHLLWSLGIRPSMRWRGPSTENARGTYIIELNPVDTSRLVTFAGEYRKGLSYQAESKKDYKDRIPVTYNWLRSYLNQTYQLSTHTAWKNHQIQLRPDCGKNSVGRRVLLSIANKLNDEYLRTLAHPATSWVRVKSIEPCPIHEEVFDLTVEGPESFLANGIIVHNCRGIPADIICLDELQDLLTDNIPVIEECASHSHLKIFMYSGTPKSLDNTIEYYWTAYSTQNEWVVPCHRHSIKTGASGKISSVYWNILTEDHIGLKSLVCDKCHNPISANDDMAQWVALNPEIIRQIPKPYEGFRIPQLMVPWISHEDLIQKQKTYTRTKFYNEVLGLSYDSGTRPLTRQDIIDNCNNDIHLDHNFQAKIIRFVGDAFPIYAGIDWGCHDDQTRILTLRGFVHFKDLTDEDQVAQWDVDTREMSFVEPKVRTVREWDQPLLYFNGKGLDMMLTHTHRMRVNTQQGGEWGHWITESAGRTSSRGGNVKFVGFVDWKGKEEVTFELPGLPTSPGFSGCFARSLSMDLWLEFLGYYLSEGGLCFDKDRPSCLKMSQRETVNPENTKKIRDCLQHCEFKVSEFPNPKTGDINWTLYGKQLWKWVQDNVGTSGSTKRVPREFLALSKRQLQILFDAMMLGDGSIDKREGNFNGNYTSTSKGLCEDFQEICIKLGLRSTLILSAPAEGNRKARWRVSWSSGRDFQFNTPSQRVEKIPYRGKVYCCAVPTGYIVTERNGCIAYAGNTGENTHTVLSLGSYLRDGHFNYIYFHRFEGREIEPQIQIEEISRIINHYKVQLVGCDYGGGFWPNDELTRRFGMQRIAKYQYSNQNQKVKWDDGLKRFLVHRTEVMSDVFNAIKRRDVFRFPNWDEFQNPFAADMLNIFSEYNDKTRQNVYKKAPNCTDDSFHSALLCFLVSMIRHPRPDVIAPTIAPTAAPERQ